MCERKSLQEMNERKNITIEQKPTALFRITVGYISDVKI